MKTGRTPIIHLLILSLIGCAAFAQVENQVRNPSFERVRNDIPIGWTTNTWTGQAEFSIEETGRTGQRSVKITSQAGADASWSQSVEVPPYARLRLSGWVKTENVTATTGRGVQLNIQENQSVRTDAITGTHDWVRLECEFEVMGESRIQINCLFGGWGQATGTVWFDDISLEVLEVTSPAANTVSTSITIEPLNARTDFRIRFWTVHRALGAMHLRRHLG